MKQATIQLRNLAIGYKGKNDTKVVASDICTAISGGELTCLLGANGVGKSTLLRTLSAFQPKLEGEIDIMGREIGTYSDKELSRTIGVVLTEKCDVRNMTARELIEMGRAPYTGFWGTLHGEDREIVERSIALVKIENLADRMVHTLSDGERQKVMIAKALAQQTPVIFLDEPTASLNESDSQALLELMLEFKKQGMTSIIISHKLNEISYVADKITVIRDGSTIETMDKEVDDFSENRIIRGMVGRELSNRFPARENVKIGEICMEVDHWTVHHPMTPAKKVVDDVSFYVRRGEVVGISGLMGAGRTELAMSLFGHSYGTGISGTIKMNGKEVHLKNVRQAIDHKLAYVTEDRKGNGLILSNPIYTNTSLAKMDKVSRYGVIDKLKEVQIAEDYRQKLHTKAPSVYQNVGNLSGGNQQKVLLAKWMLTDPDVLILDEPTRGIDVGAKYEIYCIINDLVAAGKSVIIISSELPEVLGMSDRIYVMNEGKMVGEVDGKEATQEIIMSYIMKSGKGA